MISWERKKYDIETLSIDRVLHKEHFLGKSCRKFASKASPRHLFTVLGKNPKRPMHVRRSFKNNIFWKGIIRKAWKS